MDINHVLRKKSNKIALIILAVILIVFYFFLKHTSQTEELKKDFKISQIDFKLDSIKLIQDEIIQYDNDIHIDSIFNNCHCLPELTNDGNKPTSPVTYEELVKGIANENLKQLENRQSKLEKNIDSLTLLIDISDQELIKYKAIYDSISPKFPLLKRMLIQQEIKHLNTEAINTLEYYISDLQQRNSILHYLIYFVRFLMLAIVIYIALNWLRHHFKEEN